jgi:hypothetical protein
MSEQDARANGDPVEHEENDALSAAIADAMKTDTEEVSTDDAPAGAEEATNPEDDTTAPTDDSAAPAEPVTDEPTAAIPDHWPARYRDALSKADPEVRKAWQDHAKTLLGEATRAKQNSAEYERVFTPEWQQYIKSMGHQNAASFTGELLHMYALASNDPGQFVRVQASKRGMTPEQYLGEVAKQAGITLSGSGADQQQGDEYADPEIMQLRQQVQQLASENQTIKGYLSDREATSSQSAVEKFASATDDQGNPKYPHFQAVEGDIVWLLNGNPDLAQMKTRDPMGALEKAYEMAVYANPQTRSQVIESEAEKRTRQAEVERAKRAKGAFQTSAPTTPKASPQGLDDIISDAMKGTGA